MKQVVKSGLGAMALASLLGAGLGLAAPLPALAFEPGDCHDESECETMMPWKECEDARFMAKYCFEAPEGGICTTLMGECPDN